MGTFEVVYAIITYFAGAMSVLLNASPVFAIRQMEACGSIGSNTITFFAAQMYSAIVWVSYGVLTGSIPLMVANVLGNAVGTYCILVFLSVARREEKAGHKLISTTYMTSLLTAVLFLLLSWAHLIVNMVVLTAGKVSTAAAITGVEGTFSAIFMLSSPLMLFSHIIKTKNAETLQPLMVTFAFGNTFCWTIAGVMSRDPVVFICNVLCCSAVCAQIALLLIYGRKPVVKEETNQAIAPLPFD